MRGQEGSKSSGTGFKKVQNREKHWRRGGPRTGSTCGRKTMERRGVSRNESDAGASCLGKRQWSEERRTHNTIKKTADKVGQAIVQDLTQEA